MARPVAEAMINGVVTVPKEEAPLPDGSATGDTTETVLVLVLVLLLVVDFSVVDGGATRICVTTSTWLMSGVKVGFGMSGKGPPTDWVGAMSGK